MVQHMEEDIVARLKSSKSVCLTGIPAMMRSRVDFMDMLSSFGLSDSFSVSKRTGALIVCENPSEKKIAQAEAAGVPILNENQWFELVPELEAQGMWNGKNVWADADGIYRITVGGES